jgi:cytochrome bd-type quinol oxidase subunit 1
LSQKGAVINSNLSDPAFWSRFQFGFTLTYHYLFPELTMGLAWFLAYWKWRAFKTGDEKYNDAVRFWATTVLISGLRTGGELRAFFASNFLLAGLLITRSAAIFPIMLHSALSPESGFLLRRFWQGYVRTI